ncbi:hypothetical protein RHMOL_Rhmol02G0166500 [Rhododendron molle]|uniref:Uncharacterized protein n=1 Tax=Rhododendron molle TaxID=49168 RepID=A0ACC0PSB4_RHOML|nr:hypothetical protein RHMOL_Rhmol02G0166500 [Rhododendron molle]
MSSKKAQKRWSVRLSLSLSYRGRIVLGSNSEGFCGITRLGGEFVAMNVGGEIRDSCVSVQSIIRVLMVPSASWVLVATVGVGLSPQAFQLRVTFEKDAQKQEATWERQHEIAGEKIYSWWDEFSSSKAKLEVAVVKVIQTDAIPVLEKLHKF